MDGHAPANEMSRDTAETYNTWSRNSVQSTRTSCSRLCSARGVYLDIRAADASNLVDRRPDSLQPLVAGTLKGIDYLWF